VIDAGSGTVLPGLIDAHVHLVPGALAQSLTFGVTTVLDMFSKPDLVARAIERIWRGGKTCDRHAFVASAAEAEQLTLSTLCSPRSWQPSVNAGPTDPRKAPWNAGPVVERANVG
jgi:predicted amidohydrolase YtcJ